MDTRLDVIKMKNYKRKSDAIWWFAIGWLLLDQVSKLLIVHVVTDEITVIPGVLSFMQIANSGALFGLMSSYNNMISIVALMITCSLIVYLILRKDTPNTLFIALASIIGGALGNIVDRILYDSVVDFIRFHWSKFPIFNIADVAITFGAIMLIIYIYKQD